MPLRNYASWAFRSGKAACAVFFAFLFPGFDPVLAFQAPFQTTSTFSVDNPGDFGFRAIGTDLQRQGENQASLPELEVMYRISKSFEIDVGVPFQTDTQEGLHYALGSVRASFDYRFFDPPDKSWLPSLSVAPQILLPSAAPEYGIGTGYVHAFLPLIIEKDIGNWSLVGNVAYEINPGDGNRDYVFIGASATHPITDDWSLGGDIYYQSSTSIGTKDTVGVEVGAKYNLGKKENLYFAIGTAVLNTVNTNEVNTFLGYQITF